MNMKASSQLCAQVFMVCVCVFTERDPSEAAGDQPVGHGRHPGGALCPAGN